MSKNDTSEDLITEWANRIQAQDSASHLWVVCLVFAGAFGVWLIYQTIQIGTVSPIETTAVLYLIAAGIAVSSAFLAGMRARACAREAQILRAECLREGGEPLYSRVKQCLASRYESVRVSLYP